MKIPTAGWKRRNLQGGFSLVETIVGFGVTGIAAASLMASFCLGFNIIKATRENARATQVLMEKIEVFRLYAWNQVTNSSFVPGNFSSPFALDTANPGFYYSGTVTISPVTLGTSYEDDIRKVTVAVNWTSGKTPRHREVTTYVSRYGIQNYVY
jgi:type II secretory pathway pseudopilin PulG